MTPETLSVGAVSHGVQGDPAPGDWFSSHETATAPATRSYCEFHLGDNMVHLHFLRKVALANPERIFLHSVHACHRPQLEEMISDVPNISLGAIEDLEYLRRASHWRNVWKNVGAGTTAGGYWETHPRRDDFVAFHLDWFEKLSAEMGVRCPMSKAEDFLFDYPMLKVGARVPVLARDRMKPCALVVNSQPCSGQLRVYDSLDYLTPLIAELTDRWTVFCTQRCDVRQAICTKDYDLTVSEIGQLSCYTPLIVAVATGPMWPTFNVWNQETVKLRVILLDRESVVIGRNVRTARTRDEARSVILEGGMI